VLELLHKASTDSLFALGPSNASPSTAAPTAPPPVAAVALPPSAAAPEDKSEWAGAGSNEEEAAEDLAFSLDRTGLLISPQALLSGAQLLERELPWVPETPELARVVAQRIRKISEETGAADRADLVLSTGDADDDRCADVFAEVSKLRRAGGRAFFASGARPAAEQLREWCVECRRMFGLVVLSGKFGAEELRAVLDTLADHAGRIATDTVLVLDGFTLAVASALIPFVMRAKKRRVRFEWVARHAGRVALGCCFHPSPPH
jgi:hypothetical protein